MSATWMVLAAVVQGMWTSNHVVELTDKNFDELVTQSTDSWLLDFYAPWCGHCKHLAPHFEDAAKALQGSIRLGAVDCTAHTGLQRRFNVKGFPTLKFIRGSEVRAYNGPRTKAGIVEFGREVSGEPITTISSPSQLDTLLDSGKTLIYRIKGSEENEEHNVWEKVAFNLQGLVKFTQSSSKEVDDYVLDKIRSAGLNRANVATIVVLSKGANPIIFHTKGSVVHYNALAQWVKSNSLPLVSELSGANFEELTASPDGKLTVLAVVDHYSTVKTSPFVLAFFDAARKFQGHYVFAVADMVGLKGYLSQFGFSSSEKTPGIFVLDADDDLYYLSEKVSFNNSTRPTSQSELRSLMTDFLSGVADGTIGPVSTIPWYNPARFIRKFEKWVGQFPDSYVLAGTIVAVVVFVLGMMGCCIWFVGGEEDLRQSESEDDKKEQKEKKQEKKEEKEKEKKESKKGAEKGKNKKAIKAD